MRILGHGIDIVDTKRMLQLQDTGLLQFWTEAFTQPELSEIEFLGEKERAYKLSGKFAVKEAIYKAFGGFDDGKVCWQDIEVLTKSTGQPYVNVYGKSAERCTHLCITEWLISISHSSSIVIASVIGIGHLD